MFVSVSAAPAFITKWRVMKLPFSRILPPPSIVTCLVMVLVPLILIDTGALPQLNVSVPPRPIGMRFQAASNEAVSHGGCTVALISGASGSARARPAGDRAQAGEQKAETPTDESTCV